MSSRYYSNSTIFGWLRKKLKVAKPRALGWGGWEEWDANFKATRPIAFFITETLPSWMEWIPEHTVDYFHEIRIWCSNVLCNTHGLQSTLRPGKWHEFDTRILYSCFDSFIDFIECEEASHQIDWEDEDYKKKKYGLTWASKYWLTRGGQRWRCVAAGLDHLKWEMSLTDDGEVSHQASSAVEKMILYSWWKSVRPARKDVWDETGFRTFWDSMDEKYGGTSDWLGLGKPSMMTAEERRQYRAMSDMNNAVEAQREAEDTEMLTRLIKIRGSLWT